MIIFRYCDTIILVRTNLAVVPELAVKAVVVEVFRVSTLPAVNESTLVSAGKVDAY